LRLYESIAFEHLRRARFGAGWLPRAKICSGRANWGKSLLALSCNECQRGLSERPIKNSLRFPAFHSRRQLIERREKPMKFRPLHDRVVVRRLEGEEKTKGGIIIPDTAKEKPQEGEVIAVGPGARDEHGKLVVLELKAGDRILFGKWSGTEVKIDGEELLIMKESDVMGVIEHTTAAKKKAA
jgi:chaperonin GroES